MSSNSTLKKTMQPRLRFPEFRDAGEWEVKRLEDVCDFVDERISIDQISIMNYISTENMLPEFQGVTTASKLPTVSSVTHFKVNDVLISNIRPYLKKIWFSDSDGGASNDVIVIRARDSILDIFLSSILKNDSFVDFVMSGAKGVKMPRGDIDQIREYLVCIPSPSEQQRIADCLSSLDDVIAAQSRKLDVLREHRKGLMQQLFPAKGETVPQLRFPEFRNIGEWKQIAIGKVASKDIKWSFTGGPFGSNLKSSDYTRAGVRIIQLQNIGDGQFLDDYKVFTSEEKANELLSCNIYPGEIILSKMGDPVARACLIPNIHKRYVMCSDGIRLSVDKSNFDNFFIYSLLNSTIFRNLAEKSSTGSTRKRIGIDELRNLVILSPSLPEQQRIADCLIPLDNLIAAQSRKLDSLREYKKGLMQKLFPAVTNERQNV